MAKPTPVQRFWDSVDKTEGCWLWTRSTTQFGYGRFFLDGRDRKAHCVSWEWFAGPVPAGLELDHLCSVPRCIRPDHLEPVTHQENVRRASRATKTHCDAGHAFDTANTYITRRGWRQCRACRRARKAKSL